MTTRDVQKIPEPPDLVQRLQEMTCYLPDLEDPDFWLGDIRSAQKTDSGSIIMPYVVLNDVAEAFVATRLRTRLGIVRLPLGIVGLIGRCTSTMQRRSVCTCAGGANATLVLDHGLDPTGSLLGRHATECF